MKLALCPTPATRVRELRRRRLSTFPRLVAMHIPTRQVFEVSRLNADCHPGAVARRACDFGPAWRVWPEYRHRKHECDAHLKPAA